MDAIAVPHALVGIDLQADELVARMRLALDKRRLAYELVALCRDREPDPGFERIGLIRKFVASEDEPRFDAEHVECFEPQWPQFICPAGFPDRVENCERVLRMTEDLVAELTRIAGSRNDHGRPFEMADAADREPEPAELGDGGLRWRGPDHLREELARLG